MKAQTKTNNANTFKPLEKWKHVNNLAERGFERFHPLTNLGDLDTTLDDLNSCQLTA